ncbi:sialate:O-sulfotransferase 1-like isoform X2 [Watersipora subatra]|uniref:sialate:O-sulfotransferase 1-like isoform X2 n=1 Tax=Watersipora subatra TaxID=2589382 RepID=UPI00355BFA58
MSRRHLALMFGVAVIFSLIFYIDFTNPKRSKGSRERTRIQPFVFANGSLFTSKEKKPGDPSVCYNISPSKSECNSAILYDDRAPQKFPLQFVSGAPGSGNDWIMWLASLNSGHTCEIYPKMQKTYHVRIRDNSTTKVVDAMNKMKRETSECVFLKTHEPWHPQLKNPLAFNCSLKTTLLLRHPYDAAFADYKRRLTPKSHIKKSSIEGVTTDKFFNLVKNSTNSDYMSFLEIYAARWSRHMHYWLEQYNGLLHVMIYNNVKADTVREIEEMQSFFGYHFNDTKLRR